LRRTPISQPCDSISQLSPNHAQPRCCIQNRARNRPVRKDANEIQPCDRLPRKFDVWIDALTLFQTVAKSGRFLGKLSGDRETDWNSPSTWAASAEMESIRGRPISPRIPKSSFNPWCFSSVYDSLIKIGLPMVILRMKSQQLFGCLYCICKDPNEVSE
jgi:hypothetical protein